MSDRQYQPAWNTLKSSTPPRIQVSAIPRHHKRIIKAVTKEKWLDDLYKFECLNRVDSSGNAAPVKTLLRFRRAGSIITFWLQVIPHLDMQNI